MLILCGVFLIAAAIVRLVFPQGWVADFGPPVLAIILAAIFIVVGRDPALTRSDQN